MKHQIDIRKLRDLRTRARPYAERAGIVARGAEQTFYPAISDLASGVYFVRVTGESLSAARAVAKIRLPFKERS